MYKKKRRQPKPVTKVVNFRFFNDGIQYVCSITSPVDIPNYRLKEVFDRIFVGQKKAEVSVLSTYTAFKRVHHDITYIIKTAKEFEECQTNK